MYCRWENGGSCERPTFPPPDYRIRGTGAARATQTFSRSTRKIALTPAGKTYRDFARAALAAIGSADESLRTLRSDLTGQIRLTAPFSWGQRVLAPVASALLPLYVCDDDIAAGRLVKLLPAWVPVTKFCAQVIAVVAPDRMRLSRNQAFIDFLRERLS